MWRSFFKNSRRCGKAIVIALALSACVGTGPPPGFSFPRHSLLGQGPTGRTAGTVDLADGCLFLELEQGRARYLLVWPAAYSMLSSAGDEITVSGDGRTIAIGDFVEFGGGYYASTNELPDAVQRRDDMGCSTSGPYWLVTSVISTGAP